jgi:hypothetical protein
MIGRLLMRRAKERSLPELSLCMTRLQPLLSPAHVDRRGLEAAVGQLAGPLACRHFRGYI